MFLQKIYQQAGLTGTNISKNYSASPINGIVIALTADDEGAINPIHAEDYLTVVLRDGESQEVIVHNVPLRLLAYLSSLNHGLDYNTSEMLRDITETVENLPAIISTPDSTLFNTVRQFSLAIPLGLLDLRDGGNIDISLQLGAGETEPRTIGIYAYHDTPGLAYNMRYRVIQDSNSAFHDVQQAFVTSHFGSGRVIEADYDLTVTVRANGTSYITPVWGLCAYTNLFLRGEALAQEELALLYQSEDDIPDTIHVELTGDKETDARIFLVERHMNARQIKQSAMRERDRIKTKVQKMERENPAVADALQSVGRMMSSGTV